MSSPPLSPLFPPSPSENGSLDIDWFDDLDAETRNGKEIDSQRATMDLPGPIAKRYAPAHLAGLSYHPRFFSSEFIQRNYTTEEPSEDDCDFVTRLLDEIAQCGYFCKERGRDQAVLFLGRDGTTATTNGAGSGGPRWFETLLKYIRVKLDASVEGYDLVFPSSDDQGNTDGGGNGHGKDRSRQVILNLYEPGQGLTSHIDLPHQFGDGILVCSFGSGCTMRFSREVQQAPDGQQQKNDFEEDYNLYLEDGSLLLLSGESRWVWKHGIEPREEDLVECRDDEKSVVQRIRRGKRLSITIRWLLSHEERQRKMKSMQEREQRQEQDMVARRV